jgi:hypothetical protein
MSAWWRAEPYSLMSFQPAQLLQVLEEMNAAGLTTGERAVALALMALADPRTNTARASAREIRRLAGDRWPLQSGGGGRLSGATKRLQQVGLIVKVPAEAGGGWMLSPGLCTTAGAPSTLQRRWRKFRGLLTEAQQAEQLKVLATATEQQQPEPVAAAA